jgi:hypothetical protein
MDITSSFQSVIIFLKLALGTGMISLGSKYKCGLVLTTIISAFVALFNFYVMFLFAKVSWSTKCSSFEEMWKVLFDKATLFILDFFPFVLRGCLTTYYASFAIRFIQQMLNDYDPTIKSYLLSQTSLSSRLSVFVLIPSLLI